jgi:hypothetical protein
MYRQNFLELQTLKLNNKKWEKSSFHEEKSLVRLTPEEIFFCNGICHENKLLSRIIEKNTTNIWTEVSIAFSICVLNLEKKTFRITCVT